MKLQDLVTSLQFCIYNITWGMPGILNTFCKQIWLTALSIYIYIYKAGNVFVDITCVR